MKKITFLGFLITLYLFSNSVIAEDFSSALATLQRAESGTTSQTKLQQAWSDVTTGDASNILTILSAMREVEPVAENWLRGAVDAVAERQLRETGKLPIAKLEEFVLNEIESPRARRTAFEWLAEADSTAKERLLPQMLDDQSLELRYDAVARLIAEAKATDEEKAKLELYRRALVAARALDQMTECIDQLGELGETPDLKKHFSYVTNWMVIGPFDNSAGVGMSNVYPPEEKIDFSNQLDGKSGKVSWTEYQPTAEDLEDVGRVDLNSVLQEEKGVVAYTAATVYLPNEQEVQCRYETVNATELWVNGQQMASDEIYHAGGEFDQYVVPVKMKQGKNTILLKICQNEQTETWARPWNFRLRITDALGAGVAHSYEP